MIFLYFYWWVVNLKAVSYTHLDITAFEDPDLVEYLHRQGYEEEVIQAYRWRSYPVDRAYGCLLYTSDCCFYYIYSVDFSSRNLGNELPMDA